MTLKNDIEQEKKELERQLLSEINRFEKRTGFKVEGVNFEQSRRETFSIPGLPLCGLEQNKKIVHESPCAIKVSINL